MMKYLAKKYCRKLDPTPSHLETSKRENGKTRTTIKYSGKTTKNRNEICTWWIMYRKHQSRHSKLWVSYGLERKHKWRTRKDNNYRAWMERHWSVFLSKTYGLYQIMFKKISFKARQKRCLKQHERGKKPMNYHGINSMIFTAKEDNSITM